MQITPGINSYVTMEEANAYFTLEAPPQPYGDNPPWPRHRLHAANDWIGATQFERESALVMATEILERERYIGVIASMTQPLAWPREGITDPEGRSIAPTDIPKAIKSAQCELARRILTDDFSDDAGNRSLRRVRAGSIEVEYASGVQAARRLPEVVKALIAPYLNDGYNSLRLIP